jgi:hypothetical protein
VWITTNDGGSWTDLTAKFRRLVPDTTYVSRIEMSPHDANRFYVTFDNHRNGDHKPYVFVTRDAGNTFRSITANLPADGPDFVHVIREDPVNPNLLYVGTDVGLYISLDQGQSWRKWENRFPTVPVHDLKIHPRDRELIVATHGRSLWIVDVAPLQQLTPQVMAAAARPAAGGQPILFEPAPGLQYGSPPVASSIGGEYHGHSWFRGDNKPFGAEIVYFNPVATEPVRIAIAGPSGDTIQTLTGSGAQGVQRVLWNFRGQAARVARELTPSERRDSLMTMQRADVVADSLVAAGDAEEVVRRVASMLKGEPQAGVAAAFAGGGGGGGGGGAGGAFAGAAQRPWADRPGEGTVGGGGGAGGGAFGGGQAAELQRVAAAFRGAGVPGVPGAQVGTGGGGGFGAGAAPLVDAGTYGVSATIGGRTLTTRLQVVVPD